MEKRSYKFGELKAKLQESASEFKPVFGDGVESKEKEINRQANKDIQKAAADLHISESTVKWHFGILYTTLNVSGKDEILALFK